MDNTLVAQSFKIRFSLKPGLGQVVCREIMLNPVSIMR